MTGGSRRVERSEWFALAVGLVPFVVAIARAAAQDWMPIGDAAYFTVRSRDVFTGHTPLLGAWSSGSAVVGTPVNNLGPLHLDLLSPFTKLSPYLGTGVGSAVINAGSVTAVWWAARRLFGPWRVVWIMCGTTLFVATLGLSWLIDARQQFAMVLPSYALLWLTAAMWAGVAAAVPIGLIVGSLTLQTHFTYAYQTLVGLAAGIAGYVAVTRRDRRPWARTAVIGLAVIAICWVQPLIDQVAGTGNIGHVLGPARAGQSGTGVEAGIQILAGGSLIPPFWLPGSIGLFLQPYDGTTLLRAIVAVALWAAAAGALVWRAVRSRQRGAFGAGAAGLVALVGGLIAATEIPVSLFGLVPQNYFWVWSVGAFLTIALLAGTSDLPAARRLASRVPVLRRPAVPVAVLGVVLAVAAWPRYPIQSIREDESDAARVGRSLRSEIAEGLASGVVDREVEVDLSRAFFGNDFPFVMLVELQRAGIEFRFVAGSRNLDRFGESRCVEAGRLQRLLIIPGPNPSLRAGSLVLAEVAGITDDELVEYDELQRHFGDALRRGTVTVDQAAVRTVLDAPLDKLNDVLDTAGMRAAGLARSLDDWRRWGFVEVPPSERAAFDRWFDLERRSTADFQTVVVETPLPGDGQRC
jgi:hypothetical protein